MSWEATGSKPWDGREVFHLPWPVHAHVLSQSPYIRFAVTCFDPLAAFTYALVCL